MEPRPPDSRAGVRDRPLPKHRWPGTQSGEWLSGRYAGPLVLLVGVGAVPAAAQNGPRSCSVSSQNLYVRDVMLDLYLWRQNLPDVNATAFPSPEAYLEAVRYRELDSRFSYITSAASSNAFYSDSQFIGFGFSTSQTESELRVLQVFPDSPASEAGLARGDRILEIDGRTVESLIASGAIGTAFGPSDIGVSSTVLFRSREGTERREQMTKRPVTIPTVSLTRVYEVDGRRVGYLFFRNFVRPSVAALDEAFASLREAGVSELVLDLRYNGGGLVDVAVHLGSLIGGAVTAGQPFATYAHNDRNAFRNETTPVRIARTTGAAAVEARRHRLPLVGVGQRAGDQRAASLHAGGDHRRRDLRQAGRAVPDRVLRQGAGAGLVLVAQCERRG